MGKVFLAFETDAFLLSLDAKASTLSLSFGGIVDTLFSFGGTTGLRDLLAHAVALPLSIDAVLLIAETDTLSLGQLTSSPIGCSTLPRLLYSGMSEPYGVPDNMRLLDKLS
ncbi:hypothetical protein B0A48_00436 [Cryoendolithus antarcticus]|uniref:Uncharacterized protein n=1 Tax=Cryoendolithus antarcticus TaxID=1507870 RepID=A0A1V8TUR5_9PEZI|nr:hypothetical protein B0A48_00436 [Cryoendolithus antarcticus]